MNQNNVNSNIQCSVSSCAYHNPKNYCSLNQIKVGCCDSTPTSCRGTECASFQVNTQSK